MTHDEALRGNLIGLTPSACAGELIPRGRYEDLVMPPGGGVPRPRTVEVLRCASCGTYIPMAGGRPLASHAGAPEAPCVPLTLGYLQATMPGPGRDG